MNPMHWIAACALAVALGAVAAADTEAQADREDAEALSSREWAGRQVCGPNKTPEWLDDKTLRCLKELP